MSEKVKLLYDVMSMPHGMNLDKIVQIWKEHDLVLYDSILGEKPMLVDAEEAGTVLIDVSNTSKEKLKQIDKLIKE